MSIRVLLVDDQSLLRLGFRMVLEAQPDIEVVGEAGDGAQAVAMTRSLRPDVVLMDVHAGDGRASSAPAPTDRLGSAGGSADPRAGL